MSLFCTQCGAPHAAGQRFCTACGAALDAVAPKPPPAHRGRTIAITALVVLGIAGAAVLIWRGADAPSPPPTAVAASPSVSAPTVAVPPHQPASPAPGISSPPAVGAAPPASPPPRVEVLAPARWQRYTNTRYGVTVDYPADLFTAEPAPPDNAGRGFTAAAERARLSVYSHANALNVSREELEAEDVLDLGDHNPRKLASPNGYALVGVKDGEMIVRRVLLSEGGAMVHRLEIAYPVASAKRFEAVMARVVGSLAVDPSIPERAAAAAEGAAPSVIPGTPPRTRHAGVVLPPPAAPASQSIDSIALGLKAPGTRGRAGVTLQIPADWKRVALPERFLLAFAGASASGGRLRLLVEAIRAGGQTSLVREAEAIKSTIRPGVDNYREQDEADIAVASRPARRLTLSFVAMDDPAPQRQDYVLVRAGDTLFKILVDGPERDAVAIRSVFDRVLATLAVAE